MKFIYFLQFFCSVSACIVRREWNTLSIKDKNDYISSIKDLMNRNNSYQALDPTIMSYNDFVELHVSHTPWVHGDPMFLPFHRGMIRQFELAILSTNRWNQGLVYWDWSKKYNNWYDDDIFTYIGNMYNNETYCVLNGNFSENQYITNNTYSLNNFPLNHSCLHRNNNETKHYPLISDTIINQLILSANDYKTFHGDDTSNYHAIVHGIIGGIVRKKSGELVEGGEFANPYYSAVDPLFYFHHSYIDKIWYQWQTLNNSKNMLNYNGNTTQNINYIPPPYSSIYNLPEWNVYDMLNLNNEYCYDNIKPTPTPTPMSPQPSKSIPTPTPMSPQPSKPTPTPTPMSPDARSVFIPKSISGTGKCKIKNRLDEGILKYISIPDTAKIYKLYSDKVSVIENDKLRFIYMNRSLPKNNVINETIYDFLINKWQIDPYKMIVFYNKINNLKIS